ncbi:helix-turn-helix domain-containing protein [Nocardia sp. NPDC060256]|uniref:helix-turn-helix domain-containing protein n=1 Tax=unclassified Nocardia TaxID=2637762 RepID=UPI003660AF61
MSAQHGDLGRMLREWRERVTPALAGVSESTLGRRTPGLRREELGGLAGVSADYIKRLEQGRARPSMAVLDALSRALRLSRAEYEHLCTLAGYAPAGEGCAPTHLGPGARRLLDRLDNGPVGVFTAAWTQLAANPSWTTLFYDPNAQRGHERNLAWREFTGLNQCVVDPEENKRFRASLVADLRAAAARYPADQELTKLIAALRSVSDCFAQAWDTAPPTMHSVHRAVILHPQVGPIHLDYDILTIHSGDLRVAVFTAEPDSDDAQRLALAHVIGLQDFSATEPHQH